MKLSKQSRVRLLASCIVLLFCGILSLALLQDRYGIRTYLGLDEPKQVAIETPKETSPEVFLSYGDIPCVESACFDTCQNEGFTDKLCATKCEQYEGCIDLYQEDLVTNEIYAVQSVTVQGAEVDAKTIQVEFDSIMNEITILEGYIDGVIDKDLYKNIQEKKADLIKSPLDRQEYEEASGYVSLALQAYDIVSISNVYLPWTRYVSDLPTNIYQFTMGTIEDAERLKVDLKNLATVYEVKNTPKYLSYILPNDEYSTQQWHMDKHPGLNAFRGWELLGEEYSPVKIAMIDDGIYTNHPELNNHVINEVTQGPHGTHVAGIITAVTDNQKGISSVVQNRAQLLGYAGLQNRLSHLLVAVDDGAKVINMSFGCDLTPGKDDEYIEQGVWKNLCRNDDIQKILLELSKQGIMIVAAAGNDGKSLDYVTTPAAYKGVIAVGASDKQGQRADFSQYGKTNQYGEGIDIFAPGVDILSTMIPGSNINTCSTQGDEAYGYCSGTSMAAPLVSSAIGMIKSILPYSTYDEVIDILTSSSVEIKNTGEQVGSLGLGLLDVCRMIANITGADISYCDGRARETTLDTAPSLLCGNGIIDAKEECDDGITSTRIIQCGKTSFCQGCICQESYNIQSIASCTDGILNGNETDVDCGGTCGPCGNNYRCNIDNDCASHLECVATGTSGGSTTSGTASIGSTSGGTTNSGSNSGGNTTTGMSTGGSSTGGSTSSGSTNTGITTGGSTTSGTTNTGVTTGGSTTSGTTKGGSTTGGTNGPIIGPTPTTTGGTSGGNTKGTTTGTTTGTSSSGTTTSGTTSGSSSGSTTTSGSTSSGTSSTTSGTSTSGSTSGSTSSGSTSGSTGGSTGGNGGCLSHADCSDGLYCNGVEFCQNSQCVSGDSPCQVGQNCNEQTNSCENIVTCNNGIKDNGETGIDCGSVCPNTCGIGSDCLIHEDCSSGVCEGGISSSGAGDSSMYVSTSNDNFTQDFVPGAYFVKIDTSTGVVPIIESYDERIDSRNQYADSLNQNLRSFSTGSASFDVYSKVGNIINDDRTKVKIVKPMFDTQKVTTVNKADYPIGNTYYFEADITDPNFDQAAFESKLFELAGLGSNALVEKVVPMFTFDAPNDPQTSNMRYIPKIEADKAWQAGATGNSSVIVAVVDDGFTQHPDLTANVVSTHNAGGGSAYNGCIHGTHTAGSVAAVTDNNTGISAVSHNVGLMLVAAGSSCGTLPYAYQGVQHAAQAGADFVSMSFGGGGHQASFQNLINSYPNTKFIAASGNNGSEVIKYPCAYDGVYCVGASDAQDVKAGFSNYGGWVDIAAPGTSILSTFKPGGYSNASCNDNDGNGYDVCSGTSMATPIVASLAALLKANGSNDPLGVISSTADAMPNSGTYNSGKLGAGRINVCRAVNQIGIACTAGGQGSGSTSSSSGSSSTSGITTSGSTSSGSSTSSSSSGSSTSGSSSGGSTGGNPGQYGQCVPFSGTSGGSTTGGTNGSGSTSSNGGSTGGGTTPIECTQYSNGPQISGAKEYDLERPGGNNSSIAQSFGDETEYLIMQHGSSTCGACTVGASYYNNDTLSIRTLSTDSNCEYRFITPPNNINSRLGTSTVGGSSTPAGSRSFYIDGSTNYPFLYEVMENYGVPNNQLSLLSTTMIVDRNGENVYRGAKDGARDFMANNCNVCMDNGGTSGGNTTGTSGGTCTPDCNNKSCGPDGCGGTCGSCESNQTCNPDGTCQDICISQCSGLECGSDGCGGSCGSCNSGEICNNNGQCESTCTPQCSGLECGSDGCGGTCGSCNSGEFCNGSQICEQNGGSNIPDPDEIEELYFTNISKDSLIDGSHEWLRMTSNDAPGLEDRVQETANGIMLIHDASVPVTVSPTHKHRAEFEEKDGDQYPADGTTQFFEMQFFMNEFPDELHTGETSGVYIFQRFNRLDNGPDISVKLVGHNHRSTSGGPGTKGLYIEAKNDNEAVNTFLQEVNNLVVAVYNHESNGEVKVSLNGQTIYEKSGFDTTASSDGNRMQTGIYPSGLTSNEDARQDQVDSGEYVFKLEYYYVSKVHYNYQVDLDNFNSVDYNNSSEIFPGNLLNGNNGGTSTGGGTTGNTPVDSDNDGIQDSNDNCPNTANGANVDSQGCTDNDNDSYYPDALSNASYYDPNDNDQCIPNSSNAGCGGNTTGGGTGGGGTGACNQVPDGFTVAFIGDTQNSSSSRPYNQVIDLIEARGTDLVIHDGDFAYNEGDGDEVQDRIDQTESFTMPFLASVGNHDEDDRDMYKPMLRAQMQSIGEDVEKIGDRDDMEYTVTYNGIKFIFMQEDGTKGVSFLEQELQNSTADYNVCVWHRNMHDFQVGGKSNEMTRAHYQICQDYGAMVVNGHQHNYSRTKTHNYHDHDDGDHGYYGESALDYTEVTLEKKGTSSETSEAGKNFSVISGIGGKSCRDYDHEDEGDNIDFPWFASIYAGEHYKYYDGGVQTSSDEDCKQGTLFVTYSGDEAYAEFVNINNKVIDSFTIKNNSCPGGSGGGTTTTPEIDEIQGRCGSPDGSNINYPGNPQGYSTYSCTDNGCSYCDNTNCYIGGTCYYFCGDESGNINYSSECAQGNVSSAINSNECSNNQYCGRQGANVNGGGSISSFSTQGFLPASYGQGVCQVRQSSNSCGNGVTDPREQCDDGNTASNDGCNSDCNYEYRRCRDLACTWTYDPSGVVCENNTHCAYLGGNNGGYYTGGGTNNGGNNNGGTITGGNTVGGTVNGGSVSGGETNGSTTGEEEIPTIPQAYPKVDIVFESLNDVSIGQKIVLPVEVVYNTYTPLKPTASLTVQLDYPVGFFIEPGTIKTSGEGYNIQNIQYLERRIFIDLSLDKSEVGTDSDIYSAILNIPFTVGNLAFETSQFDLDVGCINLEAIGGQYEYDGTPRCSFAGSAQGNSLQSLTRIVQVPAGRAGTGEAGPQGNGNGGTTTGSSNTGNNTGSSSGSNSGSSSTSGISSQGSTTGGHGSPEEEEDICTRGGYEYQGCFDGLDNDCDGKVDCDDSECADESVCLGNTNEFPVCGDGQLFQGAAETDKLFEYCDDGNQLNGDGCSSSCTIEKSWSCEGNSGDRTHCTRIECSTHGETFSSHLRQEGWKCCSGLDSFRTYTSSSTIGKQGQQRTICYDPLQSELVCLPEEEKPGRHIRSSQNSDLESILPGECLGEYIDYAGEISDRLYDKQDFCFFSDVDYEEIAFQDIASAKEQWAVETLLDYCIVKGRGTNSSRFAPSGRISRAEFIKMLTKILAIPKGIDFAPEGTTNLGSIGYLDMNSSHWVYEYLSYAKQRGITEQLDKNFFYQRMFLPNKSLTTNEVANILSRIPEGQKFTTLDIQEMLGDAKYPTRGQVSEVFVRKFMAIFRDRLYLQGENRVYFEEFVKRLQGKKPDTQYQIIQSQIEKLDGFKEDNEEFKDIYPYWIVEYLKKQLLRGKL